MAAEELAEALRRLEGEVKVLRSENAELKKKLGIRQFLKTNTNETDPVESNKMETNQVNISVKKPPPFFVNGVKSISVFNQMLSSATIIPYEMKALANGEIKVLLNNSDDYRKCRNLLSEIHRQPDEIKKSVGAVNYHTYRLPEEKPFTVFIRGLHHTTEVGDITSSLSTAGHTVTNVINVQFKKRVDNKQTVIKLPLFKVELKVQENNREIFDMKSLCFCRIQVEMPRKMNSLPQCKRCQDIGHSANYCTRIPKCVKCGDKHLVKDCKLSKSSPPRCANCMEGHTANYKGCSYYKSKTQPVKNKPKTAVERIREKHEAPTETQAGNLTNTYAEKVVRHAKLDEQSPAHSKTKDNDTTKILEILTRMEEAQIIANERILSLEDRIAAIENKSVGSPSPPRKHKKKK